LAEAVECDPGCARAWYGYACLRRQQGDLQAYFNLSKKAFECSPESRDIALAFHESSLIVQRLDEAEAAFRKALSGRRMNRRLHFFLIDLLLRQTKYADAMEAVEAAIVEFGVDQGILGAALKIRENLGPMNIPLTPKPGGSVTLCTIVKNEKNYLARCLKSAKPIVDEIIVVDTALPMKPKTSQGYSAQGFMILNGQMIFEGTEFRAFQGIRRLDLGAGRR